MIFKQPSLYFAPCHHGVAIQFAKCIALTPVIHFNSPNSIVRRRVYNNTTEAVEHFSLPEMEQDLSRQDGLASKRLEIEPVYSLPT